MVIFLFSLSGADIDFHLRLNHLNEADTHPIDYAINNWWLCTSHPALLFRYVVVLYKEKHMIKWMESFWLYSNCNWLSIPVASSVVQHWPSHVRRLRTIYNEYVRRQSLIHKIFMKLFLMSHRLLLVLDLESHKPLITHLQARVSQIVILVAVILIYSLLSVVTLFVNGMGCLLIITGSKFPHHQQVECWPGHLVVGLQTELTDTHSWFSLGSASHFAPSYFKKSIHKTIRVCHTSESAAHNTHLKAIFPLWNSVESRFYCANLYECSEFYMQIIFQQVSHYLHWGRYFRKLLVTFLVRIWW